MITNENTQQAFDADERKLEIEASINLTSAFMDDSFEYNVIAGGDFFDSAEQVSDDICNSPFKRWVIGESVVGGSEGIIGRDTECGWTSEEIADSNGDFLTYPEFEESFSVRKIEKIKICGDDAWGEFPVDFTVELYYAGAYTNVVSVNGNDEVVYEYELPYEIDGVTKAKLIISKWSAGGHPSKIIEFSVNRSIILTMDDIYDISYLEEDNYEDNALPIGKVSSNEMNLTFHDSGNIALSEMRRNKQINAVICAEKDGVIYKISLGKSFIKNWAPDTLNKIITVTALDMVSLLAEDDYYAPLNKNNNAKQLSEAILQSAGIPSVFYEIDDELEDIIIPYSIFSQKSHQLALADIMSCALGSAYYDRIKNKIVVKGQTNTASDGVSLKTFTRTDHVFQTEMPVNFSDFATVVKVKWYEIVVATNSETVIESNEEVEVGAGRSEQVLFDYPSDYLTVEDIEEPIITQSGSNITVTSYNAYVWGVVINLANSGEEAETVTSITVNGKPLTKIVHTYKCENDEAIGKYGRIEYEYDNLLVQTKERASAIGDAILLSYSDPANIIISDLWGAPYAEIQDTVTVPDKDGNDEIIQIERQQISSSASGSKLTHIMTGRVVAVITLVSSTPSDGESGFDKTAELLFLFNTYIVGGSGYFKLFGRDTENFVLNSDFSSGTTNWVTLWGGSHSASDNILSVTADGTLLFVTEIQTTNTIIDISHKYYLKMRARVTNGDCSSIQLDLWAENGVSRQVDRVMSPGANQWYELEGMVIPESDNNGYLRVSFGAIYPDLSTANGKTMEISGENDYEILCIDLTEKYGAGNEPDEDEAREWFSEWGFALKEKWMGSEMNVSGSESQTVTESAKSPNTEYFVLIDKNAILGYSGISDKTQLNFITGA